LAARIKLNRARRRRAATASGFVIALVGAHLSTVNAQPGVPQLRGTRTEEGQLVAINRGNYQQRELAKRLPPDEPWSAGPALAKALARFGLDQNTPPRSLPMPSWIVRGVYLVGQDHFSNLTYMIDCGLEGVAVIDPSFESEFDLTVGNIEKCGRSRKDVRWVINTHCHTDHSLADKRFRELGAKIIIHEADADAIENGTLVTAYDRYKLPEFPRTHVDHRLSDGQALRLVNEVFYVIHTPGHTPGSASFLLQVDGKNVLFSGETVFYDSMVGTQTTPYADNRQYLASYKKLERFTLASVPVRWDVLLPGHGTISLDRADLDVRKDGERVETELAAGGDLSVLRNTSQYRRTMYGRAASPFALQ
jgi:glyoxylase-like metal-dependent hydrolase (beta-lactamase superfamily II)